MGIHWFLDRMGAWQDVPAIIWRNRSSSYGQLLETVTDCTHQLDAQGIHPGQVVALQGNFSPTACALLLALIERSAVIVPLTSAMAAHHETFLEITDAQAVITIDETDRWHCAHRDVAATHPLTRRLIERGDPGLVLFTSGSTGKPKAILHNVAILLEKYRVPRRPRRTLTFLFFDHIGGINTLFHTLSTGGAIVPVSRHDPDTVCQAIERHAVQLLPTSPTFLNVLLFSEAYRRYDLSSLELITYGTEVMPERTLQRLHDTFPTVRLLQTYGLSEVGILRSKSKGSDSLLVKVGGEGFETKVVDGTLWIRARTAMLGYLNAPSPFDAEGWLNTGDAVEVVRDYLRILGRKSEMINVGGQKVFPTEVESVLMQIDNIRDVTVYGETNPIMGHIVASRVTLARPERLADVRRRIWARAQTRLPAYKIPQKITIDGSHQPGLRFKKIRTAPTDGPS